MPEPYLSEADVQAALQRIAAQRNFGGTEATIFPAPMLPAADLGPSAAPPLATAEGTVTPPSYQEALQAIANRRYVAPKVGPVELLQTGLGAFADIASNMEAIRRGRSPTSNVLGTIETQRQKAQEASREAFNEQQKADLSYVKGLSELDSQQQETHNKIISGFLTHLKQNPQLTDPEKETLVQQTYRALLASRIPANLGTLQGMARNPNLATFVKDVWPFLTPQEFGVLEVTQRDHYQRGDVEAIRKNIATLVNQKIATEAYTAARLLVPAVRAYVQAQQPGKQVGPIGFEDFLDLLKAQHPDKAQAFEQFFRGTRPLMDDTVRTAKDALLVKLGVDLPRHALMAEEKERLTEAEVTGKATPGALAAEERRARALPATLQERIERLQASGDPGDAAKANRLLAVADRMRESLTINLPKTPATEFIQTAQTVRLAAVRLARTVDRFDPSFVGLLGKLKGIMTRFSDLPGIPAFAERKAFANDLIIMTSDVKKQLIGAARTIPELADLARFLPDPDDNLSVADFVGSLQSFLQQYLDVMEVLPHTLADAGLKELDFSKDRQRLEAAQQKLTAIAEQAGLGVPSGGAARPSGPMPKTAEEYRRYRQSAPGPGPAAVPPVAPPAAGPPATVTPGAPDTLAEIERQLRRTKDPERRARYLNHVLGLDLLSEDQAMAMRRKVGF